MEDEHRLPLNHPTRIAVREKKLWTRELSWAIREQHRTSQTHLKMSCPCKLCDKGYRQEKYVETVLHHVDAQKMFGRDPKHYGSSKVSEILFLSFSTKVVYLSSSLISIVSASSSCSPVVLIWNNQKAYSVLILCEFFFVLIFAILKCSLCLT